MTHPRETPRFDSWWGSYRAGAITAAEFAEAVRGMERESAILRDTLRTLRTNIGATPSGEPQYLLRPAFERWCRDIDATLKP